MIQKRNSGHPWKGPLPPPPISPIRMIGDAIREATISSKRLQKLRTSAVCLSPVITGDVDSDDPIRGRWWTVSVSISILGRLLETRSQMQKLRNNQYGRVTPRKVTVLVPRLDSRSYSPEPVLAASPGPHENPRMPKL